MLILISCLLLFATALTLIILRVTQPNSRSAWMISVGGSILALIFVLLWLTQMPFTLILPEWQPQTLFVNPILFRADGLSWPFALSICGLTLSILLTAVVRPTVTRSFTWTGMLALGGLGILAVTADNPFTLLLVWSALDLTELITQLRSVDDPLNNEKVVFSFSTRALGIFLLLWANIVSISKGNAFDFQNISPSSGLFLVLAAGLRLGVLPIHLPYSSESIMRRGLGTSIRLISAVSSLALLAHVPTESLRSVFTPYLMVLGLIAAFYGSWMWLRAPDELSGRPYWIISLAALSVISALSGNSLGAVAWGCALVLVGGSLFLASVQHIWLNYALMIGAWSLSSMPFSLTAVAGIGNFGFFIPFGILAQAMLIAGYIRHSLQPGKRDSNESHERWANRVYSIGILLLISLQLFLAWAGWNGARQVGAWQQAIIVSFVTVVLIWAAPRFRILNPIRSEWEKPAAPILNAGYDIFLGGFKSLERISQSVTRTLEGEGGIMWTLLFLILLISLFTNGLP